MRRRTLAALVVPLAAAAGFFALAPGIAERGMNRVVPVPLPAPAAPRRDVVDLHADTLLWQRDILAPASRGHVDLPRLRAGGVALQIVSSVTKTPRGQNYAANDGDSDNITALAVAQLQPVRTWTSLLERSLWHATKLDRAAAASGGALRRVASAGDLRALLSERAARRDGLPVGAMLSVEGLHNLEGRLANLDRLHAAGFRMAGLTHFFDNEVAGSMHGRAKGGLTPFGHRVVRRMEALGMVVDVAHASHRAVADVLRVARRPVVSSHGGVQATCPVNRNLSDAEVRGIAATGGLVGIGYWEAAVCATTPAAIAAAIAHVRDVAGIDHVALGSDFDGAVTTGFDTAQVRAVADALAARGFTADEIDAVTHGNALRVLAAGIEPLSVGAPHR